MRATQLMSAAAITMLLVILTTSAFAQIPETGSRRAQDTIKSARGAALAPQSNPAPTYTSPLPPDFVHRVYDVTDLLQQTREPSPTKLLPPTMIGNMDDKTTMAVLSMGEGGGGGLAQPAAITPPGKPDPAESLRRLVQGTFNVPATTFGGRLVVTAPEATQVQVAELLSQLRAESSKVVQIDAHWLLLTAAELNSILRPADEQHNASPPLREIDPQALATKLGKDVLHYRATITCFNGQQVRLCSGPARTVIVRAIPVVAANAVGNQQEPSMVQTGVMLSVRPMLPPEGNAILDLQSIISQWLPPPVPAAAADAAPAQSAPVTVSTNTVDRVNVLVQQLDTTIRIPLGGRIFLVGGMTLDPASDSTHPDRQLYFLVSASSSQ